MSDAQSNSANPARPANAAAPSIDRRRLFRMTGATVAGLAVAGQGAASASALTSDAAHAPRAPGAPRVPGFSALPGNPVIPATALPDPLDAGRASIPARAPRIPYQSPTAPGAVAEIPTALPFEFKRSGYKCATNVPDAKQPWRDQRAPYVDRFTHNADGVRMFEVDGVLYDHPVGQIQYGLENITSYRLTGDTFYLNRAKAQANRLVSRHTEGSGGAWYFPYAFDWASPGHRLDFKAPWYSGMAQGEALSLFSQLLQLDGLTPAELDTYTAANNGTFASLLRSPSLKPWVTAKDGAGFLWIEEYPVDAPGTSDFTFNGFMFAALGLWDYHRLTGNPLAELLFDGALTTLHTYFAVLRNKSWYSNYCLTHQIPTDGYHLIHISLYRQLHWLSGSVPHAYLSDVLMDDYPYPTLAGNGTIAFAAGTHTFYEFNDDDAQRGSTTVEFARETQAPASKRVRVKGRGVHYLIAAGAYTGMYVPESYPKAYLLGEWFRSEYLPQRTATFPANVSIGCVKVDAAGNVTATKAVKFVADSTAPFDRRSIVNGRPMVRITAGGLTDYWAPASHVITDGR